MRKLSILSLILFIAVVSLGQERAKYNGKIVHADRSYSDMNRSVQSYDYENDFQDTLLMDDMILENIDGNTDSEVITNLLELDFSNDPWLVLHFSNESNFWAASNSSFNPAGTADRWMITPEIIVSVDASLMWKARSIQIDETVTTIETYEVYITTGEVDGYDDFTGAPIYIETSTPDTWTSKVFDLTAYQGDTIYIAIRHTSTDQGILGIDDLRVGETTVTPTGMEGDFENVEDFSLDLSPWITKDIDQSATYGFSNIDFLHSGEPMSFIAFDPLKTTPALSNLTAYEGDKIGACFAAVMPADGGQGPNDDWLISPVQTIAPNGYVSFWAKSITNAYGLERFEVGVSTGGTDAEDFTIITPAPYELADTAWTLYQYSLSSYAGQNVRIGIHCISVNAFVFCIDDIYIESTAGFSMNFEDEIEIYPNPARDLVHVKNAGNYEIELIDLMGRKIQTYLKNDSEIVINLSGQKKGIYLLRFADGDKSFTRKIEKI